jgi:LacI family transcriptional regulator
MIAHRVGLAPCSVSAVLNETPASKRIPLRTKNRILRAAARLNYKPNLSARALRTRRTRIVGVLAGDLGRPEVGLVIGAVERELRKRGYLLMLTSGGEGMESCPAHLLQAGPEGWITINAAMQEPGTPRLAVSVAAFSMEADGRNLAARIGEAAARSLLAKLEGVPDDAAPVGATDEPRAAARSLAAYAAPV